jgi:aspartyl-tRNA(Asn)/glutamyl-tRNA(Gln) amidotransferase subunit B
MRNKEEAHDYRYFPDPDLLPLELTAAYVEDLKAHLPELPDEKKGRFMRDYGLSGYDAGVIVAEKERADFYEKMLKEGAEAKAAANWLINELLGRVNRAGSILSRGPAGPTPHQAEWSVPTVGPTGPAANTAILKMVSAGTISGRTAKDVADILWEHALKEGPTDDPKEVEEIVETRGMKQVTDHSEIERLVDDIIAKNPDKVEQAKTKPAVIGWFVGQVMKASGGKANPQAVNALFKTKLGI